MEIFIGRFLYQALLVVVVVVLSGVNCQWLV